VGSVLWGWGVILTFVGAGGKSCGIVWRTRRARQLHGWGLGIGERRGNTERSHERKKEGSKNPHTRKSFFFFFPRKSRSLWLELPTPNGVRLNNLPRASFSKQYFTAFYVAASQGMLTPTFSAGQGCMCVALVARAADPCLLPHQTNCQAAGDSPIPRLPDASACPLERHGLFCNACNLLGHNSGGTQMQVRMCFSMLPLPLFCLLPFPSSRACLTSPFPLSRRSY